MRLSAIVAMSQNRVIGINNQLPWHLPADLKHFKEVTMGKPIIMGRKTYQSIGRPLPGRLNIILTRDSNFKASGCVIVNSFEEAFAAAGESEEIFIIGGAELFKNSLSKLQRIYLTEIHCVFEGDTYFPELADNEWRECERVRYEADEKNAYSYSFIIYEKNPLFKSEERLPK